MKKILIMFLLAFPILIFAIVSFTSTLIAYYVPIPVQSVEIKEGKDIMATSKDQEYDLVFQIGPEGARNNSFHIYDEFGRIVVKYNDQEDVITINNYEDLIVEVIKPSQKFIEKGLVSLKIKTINYGFTQLLIVTDDGLYEAYSDIYVSDPSLNPSDIQGVVFDYTNVHKDYLFGKQNTVELGYTYYPKKASPLLSEEEQLVINNDLMNNALKIDFTYKNIILRKHDVLENGRGKLILELKEDASIFTNSLQRNASFKFNVNDGYNIYNIDQINEVKSLGANIYLLNNIVMNDFLVFSNGTKVYGNGFKIDHSQLKHYYDKTEDDKLKHIGRYAIEFNGNNSGLYNTHIIGPLDENLQPYENIINVGFIAKSNNDRYMEAKDNIIENGRINVTVKGYTHTEVNDLELSATKFYLDNNTLIGSFLTAIEVDGFKANAYLFHTTHLILSRTKISYTAVGLIIQNARSQSGVLKVTLLNINNTPVIHSSSWRNLDDATGALSMNNFGYILKELKSDKYSDVYYKEGKNFYVNPLIMLRGGYINRGIIEFEDETTLEKVIKKERTPSFIEAMHPSIGGTYPFTIYLIDPIYYSKED